jgi:phospholipase D1/2
MRKILRPGRNCMEISDTDGSGLCIDARDYYKAFYEAAKQARHYILLAGWQFDTRGKLLWGADEAREKGPVGLLAFLMDLCNTNKDLHVLILSWDFSALYALEREWFQDILFSNWGQNDRIHFRFDSSHAMGASHHRKVAVIDGAVAFVGGMDLCEARWDDRKHLADNPYRVGPTGHPYPPVHDVQGFVRGKAAARITQLFCEWWSDSGGGVPVLPEYTGNYPVDVPLTLDLRRRQVAISRTETRSIIPTREPIFEIRQLYLDAIQAAEDMIYIENQYFSSRAVYDALADRLRQPGRNRLTIVIILPREAHALLEKVSIIRTQAWILESLVELATRTGHQIGIFATLPGGYRTETEQTYIHAKLLIVDDRFLMVGSANTNNRGMGLDTEINLSWEANGDDKELEGSIRNARVSLLSEHIGAGRRLRHMVRRTDRLAWLLNGIAGKKRTRLRFNDPRNDESAADRIGRIEDAWPLDPERPPVEEGIYEMISQEPDGFLASSLVTISNLIGNPSREQKPVFNNAGTVDPLVFVPRPSFFRAVTVRRIIFALVITAIILGIFYLVG